MKIFLFIILVFGMWKIADIAYWLGYNSHYFSDYIRDYKEFNKIRRLNK